MFPMFPGQARKAAQRYLAAAPAPAPDAVQGLLDACADHLQGLGMGGREAMALVLELWAERQGEATGCFIDLSRSTPHLVYLADPISGLSWPITVTDLVRLIGPRPVADLHTARA